MSIALFDKLQPYEHIIESVVEKMSMSDAISLSIVNKQMNKYARNIHNLDNKCMWCYGLYVNNEKYTRNNCMVCSNKRGISPPGTIQDDILGSPMNKIYTLFDYIEDLGYYILNTEDIIITLESIDPIDFDVDEYGRGVEYRDRITININETCFIKETKLGDGLENYCFPDLIRFYNKIISLIRRTDKKEIDYVDLFIDPPMILIDDTENTDYEPLIIGL